MVFDIEQHEKNKLAFLESLYQIGQDFIKDNPEASDLTTIGEQEAEIGRKVGLTRQQADRVNSDLEADGLTEFVAMSGPDGPNTSLTRKGLHLIEKYLYEKNKNVSINHSYNDIPREQVESAFREFRELSDDLLDSDSAEFSYNFNQLYEFITENTIAKHFYKEFYDNSDADIDKFLVDFENSGGDAPGSNRFVLPKDKFERGAMLLKLFGKIYDGLVEPMTFSSDAFGVLEYDKCVAKFNKNLSRKLIDTFYEKFEVLLHATSTKQAPREQTAMITDKVFVVHGHDNLAKETVARFVEKLGLSAVILHEKANSGKTIIEKFEHHADVAFAIILLTPDDVGASKQEHASKAPLKERARQNVVFEHGYFIGKLGRSRVCALHKGVEIPSDLQGVLYISLDDHGRWQLDLAKEMQAAGMKIDLNRLGH